MRNLLARVLLLIGVALAMSRGEAPSSVQHRVTKGPVPRSDGDHPLLRRCSREDCAALTEGHAKTPRLGENLVDGAHWSRSQTSPPCRFARIERVDPPGLRPSIPSPAPGARAPPPSV